MTNARIQRGFQTNTLRGTMARKKRGVNSRTLLLLLLPTLMVMLMLVGMTMPGMSAADDMTSQAGTGIGKDDAPVTRIDSPETNLVDDPKVNSAVLGATEEITASEKKETPKLYTDRDVEVVAKTVYGEALVTNSDMEMAAVVWCILNRVDSKGYACGGTIEYVTTFPGQFHGYSEDHPVSERIKELVIDVFERWTAEKNGEENVGRVLPKEYLYFWGDGKHNYFTTEFLGGSTWKWEVENPYEN